MISSWQLARRQHFPRVELHGDVDVVRGVQITCDRRDRLYNLHNVLRLLTIIFHSSSCSYQTHPPHISPPALYGSGTSRGFRELDRAINGVRWEGCSHLHSPLCRRNGGAWVIAVHGNKVSCKNETPLDINVNGIDIATGVTAVVNVTQEVLGLVVNLVDSLGKEITASYNCPLGVTEVVLTKAVNGIQVTVGGVATAVTKLLGGLVNSLLGLVLGVLKCAVQNQLAFGSIKSGKS